MEKMGTYYCAPVRKYSSPLNKSVPARGKLVNQVRNILHLSGETRKRKSETLDSVSDKVEYNIDYRKITDDLGTFNTSF